MADNPHVPPVVLTGFELFSKPVAIGRRESPLQKAIHATEEIMLTHKQSVFTFQFAALNFTAPEKNRYAYRLEGFDDQWVYTGAQRRYATYTRLDPGHYTFRVKASNNDGVWNEQGASIRITVLPPWRQTWWFRGSAVAALLGLAFTVYRWRVRSVERRNLDLERQLIARKQAEETQQRLNRELRAISNCNQTLLRVVDEPTLLHEVCRTVCREAGYRTAWVGYGQHGDAETVRPVAWAGADGARPAAGQLARADAEAGSWLAAMAMRTGRSVCVQDVATDPQAVLWRESALQRGHRSIIALPLKDESGNTLGVLTICSTEANVFTPDEMRLVEELAGDLAFGISALRARAERRQAEEALLKVNRRLDLRVQERTADLEQKSRELRDIQIALMNIVEDLNERATELEAANEKLKDLDRLKSLFIASMSHELRTPLNSIIGFSSILLHEWVGPLKTEQKENLASVLRSGRHLLALINDVIDVTKIEAGKVEIVPEDFDLHDVVTEVATMVAKDARDRGLDLEIQAERRLIHTDRRRLVQCVLNLVSNAVKFTEKGSIRIRTSLAEEDRCVEVAVSDTGIGMRPEDLERLFHPFVRLDSPLRTKVLGTGLGLYLTKKLVTEVLHGEVTVSSVLGQGSCFVLRVPLRAGERNP